MTKLFGQDIPALIYKATKGQLVSMTLTTRTVGTRGGNLTAGTSPTTSNITCEGFVDKYKLYQIDGSRVRADDRKVVIIADSLSGAVPEPGDTVTISGKTRNIIDVAQDPASATYECQSR